VKGPLKPYVAINIDYADGTKMERYLPSDDFYASKDHCNVRIGKCSVVGDLSNYSIHIQDDHGFTFDATFTNTSQSWRPETGYIFFGKERHHFSWFVAIPKGQTMVTYTHNGIEKKAEGTCYHDHNWGNKALYKLVNHWYWSRSDFGCYTVIACQIIPEKKYGTEPINVFYVAKDGRLITDDATRMEFYKSAPVTGGLVKKPLSNEIEFRYKDADVSIELKLKKKKNIIETYLIQQEFKRKLVKFLTGFNGGYFRITGQATLQVEEQHSPPQTYQNENAIWELMFFGRPS
jgi:hypothetical protein